MDCCFYVNLGGPVALDPDGGLMLDFCIVECFSWCEAGPAFTGCHSFIND